MRKVARLLTVLLLGISVSVPVHAQTDFDVWCDTTVGTENDVSASIETNGKATDGLITISYDSAVVACTEADVQIAESVDMYSVNVTDGSVKISFLAENAPETGTIAEIVFTAADENADKETLESAISFTGEAYDAKGDTVLVRTKEDEPTGTDAPSETDEPTGTDAPSETDEPTGTDAPSGTDEPTGTDAPSGTDAPAETPDPGNNAGGGDQDDTGTGEDAGDTNSFGVSAKTGDDAPIFTYLALALASGGLLTVFAVRRVKADSGKKSGQ